MTTWFLRKPEGTVFGPVEQDELLRWASTDRIGPEDAVSSDRKDWLPAAQLPGLKLWWMIEWPDGHRAGPYHVSSLAEMLADGELDGNEAVRHVHTQQAASLLQTLHDALLGGELHLGQGSLTAALCGVMRGEAMPKPAMQPAPNLETPPPSRVNIVEVNRPAVIAQPEAAALPSAVLEAAQRMHVEISEGAEALEEVLQHLPTLLRELKAREVALAAAEARTRTLQAELAESQGQFATHQRMREDERATMHAQVRQHEDQLRQAGEQAAALKAELEVARKQRADVEAEVRVVADRLSDHQRIWDAERAAVRTQAEQREAELKRVNEQLTAMKAELNAAVKRRTEVEAELRMALERVAERERNDAQVRNELKAALAAKEAGEQVRREVEAVRQKLVESEAVRQQHEQNLAKLRLQLADMEEARLQVRTQAERKEAEHQETTAALEAERDAALTQRKALQAERDAAVARAAERGELCEQMAADKRRSETQLRAELQQAQAAQAIVQQEKGEALKQVAEARQRMVLLEQTAQQQAQGQEELRQQLATGQSAQTRELAQLNATLAEQRATFESEQQQWMDKLQSMRQELETWQQRALAAPAPTPPTLQASPKSAPTKPLNERPTDKPMRPAPSADLYCLPPRKVRDNS